MEGLEEDPLYLKNFVKDHPDNKMGWYLLGKQYETQGKPGKAKYCFAQAGDVYSAFEMTKPIELDLLGNEMMTDGNINNSAADSSNRLKKRIKLIYRTVILTSLIIVALTYLPADRIEQAGTNNDNRAVTEPIIDSGLNVFYIEDGSVSNDIKQALGSMIAPDSDEKKQSIIVKAPRSVDGQWVMWQKEPIPLLSAERDSNTGKLVVSYHDSELCDCTAVDGAASLRIVKSWKQQQEQLIVLRSTMTSYEQMNGDLPEKAEALTGNYPKNIIPGLSALMRKAYNYYTINDSHKVILKPEMTVSTEPTLNAPIKSPSISLPSEEPNPTSVPNKTSQTTKPAQTKRSASEYTIVPPLIEPLEIIIDPDTHQLALVSGRVIVRKYSVGLGGEKTPQGSFFISEKVRSPNGHDNGDFGSRGMTLSNTLYAIHGTNKPSSIGEDDSLGCVRMTKEDVEELFDMAPLGTKVTIGKDKLPLEPTKEKTRFHSPQLQEEKNPGRIYKWLS